MTMKIAAASALLILLFCFTSAAQRIVVCEELYSET